MSEETIIEALFFGHEAIKDIIKTQEELVEKAGKQKAELPEPAPEKAQIRQQITEFLGTKIEDSLIGNDKKQVDALLASIESSVKDEFLEEETEQSKLIMPIYNEIKKEKIKKLIISKKIRVDGRKPDEIRSIKTEVGLLPSVHGSSVFTRGETQSLGVVTLGTADDQQLIDSFSETEKSNYFFHYNFPPFSVGETGRLATGRRELGHGALAQRALKHVLPNMETYPYTIRIVSEILESNGSSSMASVCSGH